MLLIKALHMYIQHTGDQLLNIDNSVSVIPLIRQQVACYGVQYCAV
jgi:hypothetical protein